MKRTAENLWYSHDSKWKLERQDSTAGEGGRVGILTQVSKGPFDESVGPKTFLRFEDALAELSRLEGPRAYVDEWLVYLRKLEAKGGPKAETFTFKATCLACAGRGTNIDTTKTLAGVPVVPCPRCGGTGKETVETAQ